MEHLSRFVFDWEYHPGRTNVADPISWVHNTVLNMLSALVLDSDLGDKIKCGYQGDDNLTPSKVAQLQLKWKCGFWYHGVQLADIRCSIHQEYHDDSGHHLSLIHISEPTRRS